MNCLTATAQVDAVRVRSTSRALLSRENVRCYSHRERSVQLTRGMEYPKMDWRRQVSNMGDATSGSTVDRKWPRRFNAIVPRSHNTSEGHLESIEGNQGALLCSSLTADTVEGMVAEGKEAKEGGADVAEIRLDFLDKFEADKDLVYMLENIPLPCIVTYRPTWEGGKYDGDEASRLATLKLAAALGADYVDVEFLVAPVFFASKFESSDKTKIIVSSHDYKGTADDESLLKLVKAIRDVGADIVKFATTGQDISDGNRVLKIVQRTCKDGPVIGLCMGEKGQATRILATKYGGYLTFGALSPERQTAPGQPTVQQLRKLYRMGSQTSSTKVLGIVGNPVSHSKSPAIHNAALGEAGLDYVYIPLLVDDFKKFKDSLPDDDWAGLSVTIPHKTAALREADEVDEVAQKIGAANTLVRMENGGFKAYNTDWLAAISSIEKAMVAGSMAQSEEEALKNKTVVVIGAGGAGRALAFGAASRGARVIVANRTVEKAIDLANQLEPIGQGVSLGDLQDGNVMGDVLVNTSSVGMLPREDESPVPAQVASSFAVVFDAVYTPLKTKLLTAAEKGGAVIVTGEKMFVGQAAEQFFLFTGSKPDENLMTDIVLGRQ